MARPRSFTQDQISTALRETKGMVAVAARRLGCTRKTVRAYVTRYPAVADVLREERHLMGDIAELALFKAIQAGELDAIKFYLKTQCKDRGYVERQERTGANGGPLQVQTESYVDLIHRLRRERDEFEAQEIVQNHRLPMHGWPGNGTA